MQRFARGLGIVAVFTILGPLAIAAMIALLALAIGLPILAFVLVFVDFEVVRTFLSPVVFVLLMICIMATALPSFFTGVAFAIAALCFGANSLRVAIICAVVAGIGVVLIGAFVSPSESSALFLPSGQSPDQVVGLAAVVAALAVLAASLCWLAARRLHRVSS